MAIRIGVNMTKLKKKKNANKKPMTGVITTTYLPEEERKELIHNRCLRCGRRLKKEEHRKLGYGPICYEKIKINTKTRLF